MSSVETLLKRKKAREITPKARLGKPPKLIRFVKIQRKLPKKKKVTKKNPAIGFPAFVRTNVFKKAFVESTCRGAINFKYVEDKMIASTDFVLLAMHGTTIEGFALIEERETSMYIHLICTTLRGLGKRIMQKIATHARDSGKTQTTLRAAYAGLVGYYATLGFRLVRDDELNRCAIRRRKRCISTTPTQVGKRRWEKPRGAEKGSGDGWYMMKNLRPQRQRS